MSHVNRPKVSIVIKALNEERHIAGAIESALAAIEGLDGEIILADSLSVDRTVDIAEIYPIKIVQLTEPQDRSCGAGAQLGYQYSAGEYICLMDGDMRLHRRFLSSAIETLDHDPELAGVGGLIVEREENNLEYVKRATRHDPNRLPGYVTRLDCGGVYRRAAIETVGYLGDRNLHGGEEFELGARIHAQGWRLARINEVAIDHFGHGGSAYRLLWKRMKSHVAFGPGETLRAALGREHFGFVMRHQAAVYGLWLAVYAWWLTILAEPFIATAADINPAVPEAAIILFPIAAMSVRCRSLSVGVYSVAAWNVYAVCFIPGFLRRRVDPERWIESSRVDREWDTRKVVNAR
jgi:glycosyltransferase involved in cell wall biosynthesis